METDDNNPFQAERELTDQFVPGYEGYQRRVGQMRMGQHSQLFGCCPTQT